MRNGSVYAPIIGAQRQVNSAWESAAEASIEASLPILPGLAEASTPEQRMEVFSLAVEAQRKAFVALHGGDAFGCERRVTQRKPAVETVAAKFHMEIALGT